MYSEKTLTDGSGLCRVTTENPSFPMKFECTAMMRLMCDRRQTLVQRPIPSCTVFRAQKRQKVTSTD